MRASLIGFAAAFLVVTFLPGCPHGSPLYPPPDAQDAGWNDPLPGDDGGAPNDPASVACANLRALGCPEGDAKPSGDSCETVFHHAAADRTTPTNTGCVGAAKTVDAVRACGPFIACKR